MEVVAAFHGTKSGGQLCTVETNQVLSGHMVNSVVRMKLKKIDPYIYGAAMHTYRNLQLSVAPILLPWVSLQYWRYPST